ncbi:MAG: hypothetical protein V3V31_03070 [Methylococcales bacterium]
MNFYNPLIYCYEVRCLTLSPAIALNEAQKGGPNNPLAKANGNYHAKHKIKPKNDITQT